ncbi:hypothetical protein AQUCO_00100708v1 [Aquilegia coerulea]|uniref:Sugar phosphate transporter domain-containing protein n=1 Tax=Aquilegia coerulea TaxID=218851 RepID=A0A2G5FBL8_AQUCA|nr:hypothetical protein AQUCO_00100708v1 [Aquilegia coerulea]
MGQTTGPGCFLVNLVLDDSNNIFIKQLVKWFLCFLSKNHLIDFPKCRCSITPQHQIHSFLETLVENLVCFYRSKTKVCIMAAATAIRLDSSKQYYATSSLVIGYALCSSLLAVINKYAITKFNFPGLLTALQYLTSALGVWVLGKLGFLYHDPFTLETAKKFLPAAIVFYLAIFTNTNLLRHANVDTFIVFRSLTPLLVAIADTAFRKQPCPSKLTFMSLVVILGGAVGYVATDSGFTLTAYSWAVAYLVTITTEMVYIKHMVTNLGLNTWGFVFYNNLLSLMMAPLFWFVTGEYVDVFSALGARSDNWKAISATAFTVTGVVNKFLTVAINVLIWDKHATPFGLICLLVTLVGGVLYNQSTTGVSVPVQHDSSVSKLIDGAADGNSSGDDDQEKGIAGKFSGL